jgi:hypothetical protein
MESKFSVGIGIYLPIYFTPSAMFNGLQGFSIECNVAQDGIAKGNNINTSIVRRLKKGPRKEKKE